MQKLNNKLEILVFIVFCICIIVVSAFHEPWFDELQAWSISKDSLYNILFVVPHYEGHPPLWYLILKCFSSLGFNVDLGIRIPNLLFMFGAVWLLIFKSPFPKIVRLVLPFTYFIFYQYSIISRPYSIFCFSLFLAAFFYKTRNEHPYRFMGSLALLCLSCFYGILIAGGIALAWLVDVLKTEKIKEFLRSKTCYSMLILFVLAVLLYFIIKPDENITYSSFMHSLSMVNRALYGFLVAPLDALFMNILNYNLDEIGGVLFLSYCCLGLFINISFLYFLKSYKKISLLLFPFLLFALFITFVYAYCHHVGLLSFLYIFVLWCVTADRDIILNNTSSKIVNFIFFISILIQLSWSYSAVLNEIKLPYCHTKHMSDFIKQYELDKYKVSSVWFEKQCYVSKLTKQIIYEEPILNDAEKKIFFENYDKVRKIDFDAQDIPAMINAYFDRNIFYTFNVLHPENLYRVRKKMSDSDVEIIKKIIKEKGIPDVWFFRGELTSIFSQEEIDAANYIPFKQFKSYRIWKNSLTEFSSIVYVRQSLYDELVKKSPIK